AREIAASLIAAGLAGDTPVALVENASLPGERIFTTRLDLLGLGAKVALGDGPALLLIGRAVAGGGAVAAFSQVEQRQIAQ
ncbi:MAG TPA: uroporphyrinogen-III C-methyltransferase, partial [Novosphingobium sp.]|nr:uroporphyrinogen-III C-methyltransferase [Novosphingobium sp.]